MISLSFSEVERRFAKLGVPNRFTDSEKRDLETIPVVSVVDDVFAFPTPAANGTLNILNLRRLLGTDPSKPPSFFDHPWYLKEDFAADNCPAGWHFLHMSVLPETLSQPITYVHSLWARGLELPSAIEVVLMLFLHYAGDGEQLLQKKHTWCRDQATQDRFVTVGAFGRNGLFISGHPAAFASRGLGICGRLKNAPRVETSG
jgi:hypothetical protein